MNENLVVSINQPGYLPWLGYFDRINHSDIHIVLDHVQYEKNGVVNRNKLKTPQGWTWLTVPLKTKGKFTELQIDSVEIDNRQNWKNKHWQSIAQNYSKSPFFDRYKSLLENLYTDEWQYLHDLLRNQVDFFLKSLEIKTKIVYSSEIDPVGVKSQLILNLCKSVRGTHYISGPFGRDYLDRKSFEASGIQISYHDYSHPKYSQRYSGFVPYMSIIDLLFNHGPKSLEILTANQTLSCE